MSIVGAVLAAPTFDLQSHSLHSDGELPAAQVVENAALAGLELLALSDHDTVDGVDRALGFEVDPAPIDARKAAGKPVGRPHLAAAVLAHPANAERLREEGHADVSSFIPAYLIQGKPGYVARTHPTVEEAIGWIHEAAGVAVWAHPFWDMESSAEVLAAIDRYRAVGLNGVEVFYPSHTEEQTVLLAERCAELGLLATGSLRDRGHRVEVLDGDDVRQNLCAGLGFSPEDRRENVRRIAWVADILSRNGVVTFVAAVSPYRQTRDEARARMGDRFVEVHVRATVEECERRDVKGLYERARAGEIQGFTGVSDPYEEPLAAELTLETESESPEESAARLVE